jgi:ankyrin repeat protein
MKTFEIAAKYGQLECMKYMYENGSQIKTEPENEYNTAIENAKKYGHLNCVEYLSLLKKSFTQN